MDIDSYSSIVHAKLRNVLSVGLKIVSAVRPDDPIAFFATHIRHMTPDGSGAITIKDCSICESFLLQADELDSQAKKIETTCLDAVANQEIYSKLEEELWFKVDHWRKVQVVDAWTDLTKKYGEAVQWWSAAKAMRNSNRPLITPIENRKEWKTVRVFVSSTFRDMFCERDWLVKHVFPQLRNWCAERKLHLVECDLRWGVPKDSKSREILAACLNEIDRCRDENTMPYFVGLLGSRYGWVPSESEFPEDMRRQYCWLPGMSVTTLEMFTATLWDNNPQAIMMFRDDSFLPAVGKLAESNGVDPETVLGGYRESDEKLSGALEMLKQIIRNQLPSEQCADYSCELRDLMKDGSNRLRLTGYNAFGDKILSFLKERIAQQFASVSNEMQSNLELQHNEHEQFMEQRGAVLFGRITETRAILDYVEQHIGTDSSAATLIVSGSAGTGKSSLMANVAQTCAQNLANKVVIHFVGATAGSTTLSRVIMRLWHECLEAPEDQIPTDADELKRSLEIVFRRASELVTLKGLSRLIVFIDAVNQMDSEGDTLGLLWLPKVLPHNVRLIVSTLEGETLDALHAANLPEVEVKPLTDESRKLIVTEFFRTYNKKLSDAQVEQLLRHGDAGRPLWLSLACEELRVFGTFEQLDEKIGSLAGDLLGLVQQIVERVVSETSAGGDLMQAAFSLIRASRFGLVELELLELLVQEPTLPPDAKLPCVQSTHEPFVTNISKLPMQIWAVLYLDLRQFLRPVGSSGDGRLDFYHRSMSKVVKKLMLDKAEVSFAWHRRLADYFDNRVTSYIRKAEELPHHLLQLRDLTRLEQVLLDHKMFDQLFKEDSKVQLLAYWRELGGYKKAAKLYTAAFNTAWPLLWFPNDKIVVDPSDKSVSQWVSKVISFSSQYGETDYAAERIIGEPVFFPKYGDSPLVWAPESAGQADFIELEFEQQVYITGVVVYETYHVGGIKKISAQSPDGQWFPLYVAEKLCNLAYSREFKPKINRPTFSSKTIRIDIDGSACKDWIELDAVKLIGTDAYEEEVAPAPTETEEELQLEWVSSVTNFSSQYGDTSYSANCMIGPPTVFPQYGDSPSTWAPEESGTAAFIELEFSRPLYVAAISIFETYHAGGVKSISLFNDSDNNWVNVYLAEKNKNIERSQLFQPQINRQNFKSKALRLDIDQSVCNDWCEYDAVAIHGFANKFYDEAAKPFNSLLSKLKQAMTDQVGSHAAAAPGRVISAEPEKITQGEREMSILNLTEDKFLVWLTFGVKLGWFLIDIGEFETCEKHLASVRNIAFTYADKSQMDGDLGKKFAEVFYAFVLLYRSWFTKYSYASNDEAKRAHSYGQINASTCYTVYEDIYGKESLIFGEAAAACCYFNQENMEEVIALFEKLNYKRGLVELYSLKGTHLQYESLETTREYHNKAQQLAYSEFGKFHLKTARVHQLYGQMLWNRWASMKEKTDGRMDEVLLHYWTEYEIFENLFGPDHALTRRSREDNIIILEELGRKDEAAELHKKQPKGANFRGQ